MSAMDERRLNVPAAGAVDIAGQVRADLQGWAARWPIFAPVRFPAVAQTTAVHLPGLSRSARALAGLVSLWIIAFDEVVDEDRLTSVQLADLTERCRAIAVRSEGRETVQADPLCAALQEIVRRVTRQPTFAAFGETWRAALTDMLDAIVEHRRLGKVTGRGASAGATALETPSFATVLALTTRSIGVRFYLVTSWILYEEPSLVLRREGLLRSAAASARAIRLANDLQTWKRDAAEGNVNTLAALEGELAAARPHLPPDLRHAQALRLLQEHLDAALAHAHSELQLAGGPIASAERDMGRLVAFVTRLYAKADYHTYRATPILATSIAG